MLFQGFGRWIHQILGITMQNSCMHYNMYVGDMLIHHTTTALSLRTDSGRQDTAMRQIYLQHATAILCVCVCELFGWLRMPQTKQKTEWMNLRRRSSHNVWVNIKFIYKLMQLRASHNALRCATPARLGWVQVSDENIRTVNSAGEWWATHTHDSHIAFQFLFFFGSFVSVYHAAHTKAHRAYIGIIQPQHGLSLPCLNMLHHICHLSYTTYGRRRQKKKLSELRIDICDQSRWTDEKYITDEKGIYSSRHWNRVCSTHLALFPTTSSHTQFPTTHTQRTWK